MSPDARLHADTGADKRNDGALKDAVDEALEALFGLRR
jgi:hypothetical protein